MSDRIYLANDFYTTFAPNFGRLRPVSTAWRSMVIYEHIDWTIGRFYLTDYVICPLRRS